MEYLIWTDLEMTGLEPATDCILEIATLVTNDDLEIVEIGPEIAIHQNDTVLENMSEWCIKQHGKSGLTEKVRNSKISLKEAEDQTLDFIKKYVKEKKAPLCGNSIHQDRRFLEKYMADFNNYLHYRNIDVSSLKILYELWYPKRGSFKKKENHTALEDIKESVAELKFYRDSLFPAVEK